MGGSCSICHAAIRTTPRTRRFASKTKKRTSLIYCYLARTVASARGKADGKEHGVYLGPAGLVRLLVRSDPLPCDSAVYIDDDSSSYLAVE